jgi:hypothetical protein
MPGFSRALAFGNAAMQIGDQEHETDLDQLLHFLETTKGPVRLRLAGGNPLLRSANGAKLKCTLPLLRDAVSRGLMVIRRSAAALTEAGVSYLRRDRGDGEAWLAQPGGISQAVVIHDGTLKATTINEGESPLARLRKLKDRAGRPWLGDPQFAAGERLRRDFELAQVQPSISAARQFGGIGGGRGPDPGALGDLVLDSRRRVTAAIEALEYSLAGVVLDVCCFLKGLEQVERERLWPPRSAKLMLRVGLSMLARHYGYDNDCAGSVPRWGEPAISQAPAGKRRT